MMRCAQASDMCTRSGTPLDSIAIAYVPVSPNKWYLQNEMDDADEPSERDDASQVDYHHPAVPSPSPHPLSSHDTHLGSFVPTTPAMVGPQ